jgi:ubiquinone/menaquinone biosynthesis C-methylase UbiE
VGFDPERLAVIARMEPEHFWFVGRRALMESMVEPLLAEGEPLLDLGCGTGSLVARWAAGGRRVIGLDQRPEGIAAARARLAGAGAGNAEFVVGDAHSLPFEASTFAGAFALDVLEHLDDQRALRELGRVLRPNGWVFVTVPAMPLLWSRRDELAGHLRRYTRTSLTRALHGAGLRLETMRAYQFTLLPLVALSRVFGRRTTSTRDLEDRPAPILNRILRAINLAEVRSGVPWPLGSSLAALARKPA